MKKWYLIGAMMLAAFAVSAQSYEGSITYGKKKQQAIVIDYNYPVEAVENAISKKLEEMGNSSKAEKGMFNKDKGFIVFKNATVTDISDKAMTYLVKVEQKSRRDKNSATMYLVMMNNDENAMPTLDAFAVGKAKTFVNNLIPEIEEANLELMIKAEEEVVVKSEKKFKDLQDEKSDLEKKLKKNAEDIDKQQKQIETQRQALDGLKGKRRVQS